MNAYELADVLENMADFDECEYQQSANMLRQLADENQALKDGFNSAWAGTNNSELAEVRAMANRMILKVKEQADRIAELEKAFISQRVEAYAKSLTDRTKASAIAKVLNAEPKDIWTVCLDCGKRVTGDSIHTCSPQIKELSDEEIDEVGDEVSNLIDTYAGRREFARAILKKASEK